MRIPGHHNCAVGASLGDQYTLQSDQSRRQLVQLCAQVQPNIQGHLIIPASTRVQFTTEWTDQFGQSPFNCHVDIFVLRREDKTLLIELSFHGVQSLNNRARLRSRENAGLFKCLAMSDAPRNVFGIESAVDRHRTSKGFDQPIGLFSKPAFPGFRSAASCLRPVLTLGHQDEAFFLCARIFRRNALRRINPSASFWL